jgi:hypothetical protein
MLTLDLRTKDILTREQLNIIERTKPVTVNVQSKIEERHRQVRARIIVSNHISRRYCNLGKRKS